MPTIKLSDEDKTYEHLAKLQKVHQTSKISHEIFAKAVAQQGGNARHDLKLCEKKFVAWEACRRAEEASMQHALAESDLVKEKKDASLTDIMLAEAMQKMTIL